MKRTLLLIKTLILMFVLTFVSAMAEPPEPPYSINVFPSGYNPNEFVVTLVWFGDYDSLKWFKVYLADENTEDLSKFKFSTMLDKFEDIYAPGYDVFLENITDGEYTVYATAGTDQGESAPSEFAHFTQTGDLSHYPHLSKQADTQALVNNIYRFQPKFDIDDDKVIVKFLTKPDDAVYDSLTRRLTWTPAKVGKYKFSYDYRFYKSAFGAKHSWEVTVYSSLDPGRLTVTIKNEYGESDLSGAATLYSKFQSSLSYWVVFSGGKAVFNNLIDGDYILNLNSDEFEEQWYDNKNSFSTADIIHIKNGEETIINANVQKSYRDVSLNFKSTPPESVNIGNVYKYTAYAETSPDKYELRYSIEESPLGAGIDSITGQLAWNPKENGEFKFNIMARIAETNKKSEIQTFWVKAYNCSEKASMKINFTKDDSIHPLNGTVTLYRINNLNLDDFEKPYDKKQLKDNNVEFTDLDEGQYAVFYNNTIPKNFYPAWYPGVNKLEDAELITIKCSENKELSMKIQLEKEAKTYTVSGTAFLNDKSSLLYHVSLTFMGYDPLMHSAANFNTGTDDNGKYNIKLNDNYLYHVQAIYWFDSVYKDRNYKINATFYGDVTDYRESKSLKLTGDMNSVDLILKKMPWNFKNYITSDIYYSSTNQDAVLTVYPVSFKPGYEQYNDYLFKGISFGDNFNYQVKNLIPGNYVLFAFSRSNSIGPGYYLTYNSLVPNWQDAKQFVIDENTQLDVTLLVKSPKFKVYPMVNIGSVMTDVPIVSKKDKPSGIVPVLGATVYILNNEGEVVNAVISDENGNYEVNYISPGYSITCDKIGYDYAKLPVCNNSGVINVNDIFLTRKTLDIKDYRDDNKNLTVYPNPASEEININLKDTDGITSIKLLNSFGVTVHNKSVNTAQGNGIQTLDIRSLSTGAYWLSLEQNGSQQVIPVIISK